MLVSDGVRSFTFFHYADGMIECTTGDLSGGMKGRGGREAEIGYDAGHDVNHHSIHLSGTPEIINISSTSNVNRSGVWTFRLDLQEKSMTPDYKEGPLVTCCDQSEYRYMCLCVVFEDMCLVNKIFTPQSCFICKILLYL